MLFPKGNVPFASRQQLADLDRLMVERFNIGVASMMELAGFHVAEFIRLSFPRRRRVAVLVGRGNNGGDGLVAARHLYNKGFFPSVALVRDELGGLPGVHVSAARRVGIPCASGVLAARKVCEEADVVLDALLGYNLRGAPRPPFDAFIEEANRARKRGVPVVACDVPSGVDGDRGPVFSPFVTASHVVFLALPRKGCVSLGAQLFVADIGVPKALYSLIGVEERNYFAQGSILRIENRV